MSGIAAPNVKDICPFIKYTKIAPLGQMTIAILWNRPKISLFRVSLLHVYKNALFLYNGDKLSCLDTDFVSSIGKSHVLKQFKFIFYYYECSCGHLFRSWFRGSGRLQGQTALDEHKLIL